MDYNGFRYVYTYSYFTEYYARQERNLDSLNHYHDLVLNIDHDESADSYHNILESWRMKILSYADLGDYEGALQLIHDAQSSDAYIKAADDSKAWFLLNTAEMLTNTAAESNWQKAALIHQESIKLMPNNDYLRNLNHYGLGRIAIYQKQIKKAEQYLISASEYFKITNSHMYGMCQRLLGDIDKERANNLHAQSHYQNSLSSFQSEPGSIEICDTYLRLIELAPTHSNSNSAYIDSILVSIFEGDNFSYYRDNNPLCLLKMSIVLGEYYHMNHQEPECRQYLNLAFETLHTISPAYLTHSSKIELKESQAKLFELLVAIEEKHGDPKEIFLAIDRNKNSLLRADQSSARQVINFEEIENPILQYNLQAGRLQQSSFVNGIFEVKYVHNPNLSTTDLQRFQAGYLTIIPDASTADVSFGAFLQDSSDQASFLEQDYTISYQLSTSLSQDLVKKKVNSVGISVIAPSFVEDPNQLYAQVRVYRGDSIKLYHLPYAEQEHQSIHSTLPKAISGSTKSALIDAIENKRILHFAGHAVTIPDDSDHSFLALSSDISNPDQKLTLRELYDLKSNNEMVVLSACSTAEGEIAAGEGVLSLARGFFYAGAKSVVSTLWAVNDQSSAIIMSEFYRQLKQGKRKDVALQQAKLHYLDSVDSEYQDPKYWAAFIVMGDMSPLFTPWWYSLSYGVIGIVLIAMIYLIIRRLTRGTS